LEAVLKLLAPFAPHITEEIWARTGHTGSIHASSWPDWDPNWVKSEGMAIAVQVNGKLRDVLEVSVDISQEELTELARANTKVAILLANNPVKKTIYVPGKIINFVT
jgi:leucyl-tRNA synthetase